MQKLATICAVTLLSSAALVLTGCPEEGADKDKTAEEAKPADKKETKSDDKSKTADEKKPEGDTKAAKDGEKKDEEKDEKKDEKKEEKK